MINRRKLFGFAAAAPVAAFLPNTQVKAEVTKEDISKNAPSNGPMIVLQAQEYRNNNYNGTIGLSYPVNVGPQVGLSAGKDGHLWVKVNGKWKRVMTE